MVIAEKNRAIRSLYRVPRYQTRKTDALLGRATQSPWIILFVSRDPLTLLRNPVLPKTIRVGATAVRPCVWRSLLGQ